jgi:hypothetical protein
MATSLFRGEFDGFGLEFQIRFQTVETRIRMKVREGRVGGTGNRVV